MLEVTQEQLNSALKTLGIQQGNNVLVHSALQFLGRPAGGVEMYFQTLCTVLGIESEPLSTKNPSPTRRYQESKGTLAVPAFNFGFAQGQAYDPLTTPAIGMGSFSEYVRQQPAALRTSHPMQSMAIIGGLASELAARDTASAFDPDSAFEGLLEQDFKLLLLGASIQAVSIVHYAEQRANVPYRYWKSFTGQVKTPAGWEERTYKMFVRDLELDPQLNLAPIQSELEARGLWRANKLNYGVLAACQLRDFIAAAEDLLANDPWALVANRPR